MNKKTISQSERTTLFNEWLSKQEMPKFTDSLDRKKWWTKKVVEFDKISIESYNIIPDFYIDENNKISYNSGKNKKD